MGLFNRKKKAAPDNNDTRVYAFVGLGMMARFMNEQQLNELVDALPAMIARECGASANNVVVVQGQDWAPQGSDLANSINFDGTPAYPDLAQKLCEEYLKSKGLYSHLVGDLQLLGVIGSGGGISLGTYDDLKAEGATVTGASVLLTAWLAFHPSTF